MKPANPIKSIKIADLGYPDSLKSTSRPPNLLYYIGEAPGNSLLNIAVVGSRKMSEYGKQTLTKIIATLQGYDVCIVSGLAFGVDAYAHQLALEHGIKTIAVLGTAINNIQPNINRPLARKIIESGGTLVSEYASGSPTFKGSFVERNRIIAGMSKAVVIIEASAKSGSLTTANYARKFKRPVFLVPGSIFEDLSVGTNNLLKTYGKAITEGADLLKYFGILDKKAQAKKDEQQNFIGLSEIETVILKIVRPEPTAFEEILEKTKLPINRLNSALSMLEIKNKIYKTEANCYCRDLSKT